MAFFRKFYLDKEKDVIVNLYLEGQDMTYVLATPNHGTGNLIRNLARVADLPLSTDEDGLFVIRGDVPCYIDAENRSVYILRLGDTKVANIYPDGTIERKASIPAIAKTLMSQTKDYSLGYDKTLVKTYIRRDVKFRTDLHTHMNANLDPDVLIALGIRHQIAYPLYYIRKLGLRVSDSQTEKLARRRAKTAETYADSPLTGKYRDRKINDHTFINFADLILNDLEDAAYNIPKIRASLSIMKDGQAVFTNLEKVYLYRYVFTRGLPAEDPMDLHDINRIPDEDIASYLTEMLADAKSVAYRKNTLYQDLLLWIARTYQSKGITYVEMSDTTLVKADGAVEMLSQVHEIMPKIMEETGVTIRFLAAIRRIPLTIVRDQIEGADYAFQNLQVLKAVACDPYVAGSDIIGEEINDIRELSPLIREIVKLAADDPSYVIRIHAGENDSLKGNVRNSIACVKEALAPGQPMPLVRIGHGLYTENLSSARGQKLIAAIRDNGVVLEFQITSNVRLNNLTGLDNHPLKKYLDAGILCVQGTDGGALYGTDSIDEELSLEKMLSLSHGDLAAMVRADHFVEERGMEGFRTKQKAFHRLLSGKKVKAFLQERIDRETKNAGTLLAQSDRLSSAEALQDCIRPLPEEKIPIVLLGGSFNSDSRSTSLRQPALAFLTDLLDTADPEKYFFVIGHRLTGYEKALVERNGGRFEVFAFVPSLITEGEKRRIAHSGVSVRIAIEPTGMGAYKSFAYEIFKRRSSVLLALDGNSAGANMIQEAKNSKGNCRIYVSLHSRELKRKAASLQGYVTVFAEEDMRAADLLSDIEAHI